MTGSRDDIVERIIVGLRAHIPGLQVQRIDHGYTVAVYNPATNRMGYVRRVFREDRDGHSGEYFARVEDIPDLLDLLNGGLEGDAGMTDSDAVDYSALSGANFQRAVGTDPKKWATAFAQTHLRNTMTRFTDDDLAQWFADAIEAGRAEGRHMERKITGQFW